MHTATIVAPRTVEIRRNPLPEPDSGEVRVRLAGTGVCASNLPVWQGRPWFTYPLDPGAPGHEAWGTVDAVGSGVEHINVGDRVAVLSYHAYAQYDVASADGVIRLPEGDTALEFPGEPLACAYNVFERSGIRAGDSVAVVGVGFLGAIVIALARNAGAEVTAISRRPFARDVATQMGAHRTMAFDSIADTRAALARNKTAEFDCVIEAVGSQDALNLAAELPRIRGRLVIAGYHQDGLRTVDMQSWNWRGIDVINAHERDPRRYISGMRAAIDLIEQGALDPCPLFTHRFALDELPKAFELLHDRPDGFMKALVRYDA
jgi:threonine dehydrogenase-like Zn-dependent dehydrogenase